MSAVLIVDDDQSMCELLEAALARSGFEVTSCATAQSALERLAGGDVDVVVTDLNMRGMNGIDLCTRVDANRPDVPVLVMTAFGSLDTAIAAIRAGDHDLLSEPMEM